MKDIKLTSDRLRQVLYYEKETGVFSWLATLSNRAKSGSIAGSISKGTGYLTIRIDGSLYQAHRLAWLYIYGVWPKYEIDHIDTDKLNNSIVNLRDVTSSENQQNIRVPRKNNTSGYQGVVWDVKISKWRAGLTKNKKFIYVGHFNDPELAHQAYVNAKRMNHKGNTL